MIEEQEPRPAVEPARDDPLDAAVARMDKLDRRLIRQRVVNVFLTVALMVAVSGWWLTARDHTATDRNGRVGDCRSVQLARTLDAFRIIVSPGATEADRDKAANDLRDLGSLESRYVKCSGS